MVNSKAVQMFKCLLKTARAQCLLNCFSALPYDTNLCRTLSVLSRLGSVRWTFTDISASIASPSTTLYCSVWLQGLSQAMLGSNGLKGHVSTEMIKLRHASQCKHRAGASRCTLLLLLNDLCLCVSSLQSTYMHCICRLQPLFTSMKQRGCDITRLCGTLKDSPDEVGESHNA